MVYSSKYAPLDLPRCNLLSYLFPPERPISNRPLWIDADDPSNTLSARQMLAWVRRFAVGLDKIGVQEGQAVLVFSPNNIYVPIVFLGAIGSKRRFSGANPNYSVDELVYQLKIVQAAAVFIHPTLLEAGLAACSRAGIQYGRIFLISSTECEPVRGIQDWRKMVGTFSESESYQWDDLGDTALSQVAVINFSSGTTGLPKGVCITHHNLVCNLAQTISVKFDGSPPSDSAPGPQHRWLAFLPLYHAFSQFFTVLIACKLKYPTFVMEKFVFKKWLQHIERYRITSLQLVPPVLLMLDKQPETAMHDLRSLGHVFCGAAPLSLDLKQRLSRRFQFRVTQGWGMTETTAAGSLIPDRMDDKTGSIGFLLPNTEAKLLDDAGCEVMEPGLPGELWLKGPQIMFEYLGNKKATEDTLKDGWCRTGDVVFVKDDMWWIVDRKKELIKVNGLQVAPAELEGLLVQQPDIADAAVVGITLDGQELPRAYVVLKDDTKGQRTVTEEAIKRFVSERMAKHKWLAGGIKFVDEVPKLPSGKIVRKIIKQWAQRDAASSKDEVKSKL